AVDDLLLKFPVFEAVEGFKGKVRCTLTAHELPKRVDDIKKYTETKKFLTAFEVYTIRKENPDVFEDLDEKGIVGCKVTKTVLAADPADMRRHLEGKKFKKKLEWRKKREAEGIDVSSEEEEDDEEEEEEDEYPGEWRRDYGSGDVVTVAEEGDYCSGEMAGLGKGKKAGVSVEGAESYDFSVMDTELEETKKGQKKRKNPKNGGEPAKKKAKKAK
ncbi:hypothetical protein PFISCL1PPCAC_25185, partial [Pristionchus fissidentatus]